MFTSNQPVFHMINEFPYNLLHIITGEPYNHKYTPEAGCFLLAPLFNELNKLPRENRQVIIERFVNKQPRQMTSQALNLRLKTVIKLETQSLNALRDPDVIKRIKGVAAGAHTAVKVENECLSEENKALKLIILKIQNQSIKPDDIKWIDDKIDRPRNQQDTEDINHTSIYNLGLATRTLNSLVRAGMSTLRDLITRSETDLRDIKGIGDTGIADIKRVISQHGCRMGEDNKTLDTERNVRKKQYLSSHMVYNRTMDKNIYIRK